MQTRTLLLSLGLHGAGIVGVATLLGLGVSVRPPQLRLTVVPPAPELAWPREEPRPEPLRPDHEPEEAPLVELELLLPPLEPEELDSAPEDLGPWPSPPQCICYSRKGTACRALIFWPTGGSNRESSDPTLHRPGPTW